MLIIATDEAGYGPKLGPLVVVATVWEVDTQVGESARVEFGSLEPFFETIRRPVSLLDPLTGKRRSVRIDDSKSVYKPGSGLAGLHAVISASHQWCQPAWYRPGQTTFAEMVAQVAESDQIDIAEAKWLGCLSDEPFLPTADANVLLEQWQVAERATAVIPRLIDVRARVVTAQRFNAHCQSGANKADLLSATTLGLVRDALERHSPQSRNVPSRCCDHQVHVYCDRHGGRRYYSAVIEHVLGRMPSQIIEEGKARSVYRIGGEDADIQIGFTVKGDSFAPVALSSLHAKYMRERFMESFNAYFAALLADLFGTTPGKKTVLKPTAGYPTDADRFLKQLEPVLLRQRINAQTLVRLR